jgi:hypothetical protein
VTITSSHITGQAPTTLLTGDLTVKGHCLVKQDITTQRKLIVEDKARVEAMFTAVEQCHLG